MTTVYKTEATHSLRALALPLIDKLKWRHHGIGVLQGYVCEGTEPEIRLHIWSKKLLKPGMDQSGDVHDHRFDLVSHVLCGTIDHEEWIPSVANQGDHEMLSLTHARAASDTKFHGPTTAILGCFNVEKKWWSVKEGFSYTLPALSFHRTPLPASPEVVAVTCVEKHNQRENQARLLYPRALAPIMAFGHDIDEDLVKHLVWSAKQKLEWSSRGNG